MLIAWEPLRAPKAELGTGGRWWTSGTWVLLAFHELLALRLRHHVGRRVLGSFLLFGGLLLSAPDNEKWHE
jgi:hypothetical protein